jgi:sialidase-1
VIVDNENSVSINENHANSHPGKMVLFDVFHHVEDGIYRIPSLIQAADGTLVAVCEKRDVQGDQSGNELIMRRSMDGGITWTPEVRINDAGNDALNNPTMVTTDNGIIVLMYQKYPSGITPRNAINGDVTSYVQYSDDHGANWSQAYDISSRVEPTSVAVTNVGPGNGLTVRNGPEAGRVLMPFSGKFSLGSDFSDKRAYAVYNDQFTQENSVLTDTVITKLNAGWVIGGTNTSSKANEIQMVEIANNGRLYYLARDYPDHDYWNTFYDTSSDGGENWDARNASFSTFPFRTQSGLLRVDKTVDGIAGPHIYHTTPTGPYDMSKGRTYGHIFAAINQTAGLTWSNKKSRLITKGFFSNSSLIEVTPKYQGEEARVGFLYEFNTNTITNKVKRIRYMSLDAAWVNSGTEFNE